MHCFFTPVNCIATRLPRLKKILSCRSKWPTGCKYKETTKKHLTPIHDYHCGNSVKWAWHCYFQRYLIKLYSSDWMWLQFRLCTFKGWRGGSTACVFHATWHLTLISFFVIQFHFFLIVNFRTMPFKLLQESCLEILDRP